MAEAKNTRNVARIVIIASIVLFVALTVVFIGSCGSTNDEDQLGTEDAAALVVVAPGIHS